MNTSEVICWMTLMGLFSWIWGYLVGWRSGADTTTRNVSASLKQIEDVIKKQERKEGWR